MPIYNYSNKDILELDLKSGAINDASITNSDLDTLYSDNISWNKTDIRDSNCNNAIFSSSKLTNCKFFCSSFINTQFSDCLLYDNNMTDLSLIKVKFNNSKLKKSDFDSCTMQRAEFIKSIIQDSSIKDIEGIFSHFLNTIFISCFFEITYGNGMNGFSSAHFENCIFYNCSFTGYPLRGAKITGSTFVACNGEITDDVEANCCYGMPHTQQTAFHKLTNYDFAINLINEVSNG